MILFFQKGSEEQKLNDNFFSFSLKALDSSTPFFQIGQQVYQGIYEDVCGTDLIFRSSAKKTGEKIPYTEPETSFKRIRLTPVQLQPKVNLTP